MKTDEFKELEKFIFNDENQALLSSIKSSVMDFNIFEIAGLSTQEIKYSHILAWLFGDKEHNLGYKILDGFLKKVIEQNSENEKVKKIEALKHYIYLPNKDKKITVFREKNNIDLLLVDEENKVVITIENKVNAKENIKGEEGGQLSKYVSDIENKYDGYDKFYIFLTRESYLPKSEENQKNWLVASHSFVGEVIEEIIQNDSINSKTELILNSYADLLKRQNMTEDKQLKGLCKKIWAKEGTALDILNEYKYSKIDRLFDAILEDGDFEHDSHAEDLVYFKTKIGDELVKKISNGEVEKWEEYSITADLSLEKHEDLLWFGYKFEEDIKNEKNICNKIKEKLEVQNIKKINRNYYSTVLEKNKKYILDNDFEKIKNEFIEKITKEIEKLEKAVSEVLNIKV